MPFFAVSYGAVSYCTYRRIYKEKCPLSGAKAQVRYVNLGTFYYVHIGTYCSVFITLLQVRIAVVQNSNIWGPLLKMNALLC